MIPQRVMPSKYMTYLLQSNKSKHCMHVCNIGERKKHVCVSLYISRPSRLPLIGVPGNKTISSNSGIHLESWNLWSPDIANTFGFSTKFRLIRERFIIKNFARIVKLTYGQSKLYLKSVLFKEIMKFGQNYEIR